MARGGFCMRGGPAATALFTFWDMFWGRIVSHFDNNLVFVILGHEIGDFRVPFREHWDSVVRRGVTRRGNHAGSESRPKEKGFSAWLRTLVFKGVIREAGARTDVSWTGWKAGPCGHCRAFLTGAARRLRCSEARLRDL